MATKNFGNVSAVYESMREATEQLPGQMEMDVNGNIAEMPQRKERKTYSEEEQAEARASMHTQGKKSLKLKRINLAFSDPNYEFVRTMAAVRGQSITEFINDLLADTREKNAEIYARAIEFRNSL